LDEADVLALESGCKLFREFRQGERRLDTVNVKHIETAVGFN
jgi:hypothetical protein